MRGVRHYVALMRPRHWIKNLFLFAAPFFGGVILREDVIKIAIPAFFAFSLTASSVYIFNDLIDREKDRLHPEKKARPIASGMIGPGEAIGIALSLLLASLYISLSIEKGFLFCILSYLFLQMAYSMKLKNVAILDIFSISTGFVIRVIAGGKAFHVDVSPWLFTTMFMMSLVLASGKRLSETHLLGYKASSHRHSLEEYSVGFLREVFIIASGTALVTYALYTVEESHGLIYTIPVVTFGLFRYLRLATQGLGDPTMALTKDIQLTITVIVWLGLVWFVRYR